MSFKHSKDWPFIVHLCAKHGLLPEQIYLLLAWLENEDGPSNNVFNLLHSFNPILTEQMLWAIDYIKKEERGRLKFVKKYKLVDLPEYLYYHGGAFHYGISGVGRGSYEGLIKKIEEVRNEFRDAGTFAVG